MKALLMALMFPVLSHAADWSQADTARQAVYTSTLILDWSQTRDIARHPGKYETNVILGRHPSQREVNQYFAAAAVLHLAVSYVLPRPWREVWQVGSIVISTAYVVRNADAISLHTSNAANTLAGIGLVYAVKFN